MEANRVESAKATQIMHNDYSDVFTRIGHFNDTLSLQIKENEGPYQVPLR